MLRKSWSRNVISAVCRLPVNAMLAFLTTGGGGEGGFHELEYRKILGKLSFRYYKGLAKYLKQKNLTAHSSKDFRGFLM